MSPNQLPLSFPGSPWCPPCPRSAPCPGCAPTSPTSTPSPACLAWRPDTATAAPAAPRRSGPPSSYPPSSPSRIPWSLPRPSSCPRWTRPKTSRRDPCWGECSSTPVTHKTRRQMLGREKRRGVRWRRGRRGRWPCCLWAGEAKAFDWNTELTRHKYGLAMEKHVVTLIAPGCTFYSNSATFLIWNSLHVLQMYEWMNEWIIHLSVMLL